jgi:hypothetical protein
MLGRGQETRAQQGKRKGTLVAARDGHSTNTALKSLTERATARGTNIEGYVQDRIEKDILPQQRTSEIMAPFRQEVLSSGHRRGTRFAI